MSRPGYAGVFSYFGLAEDHRRTKKTNRNNDSIKTSQYHRQSILIVTVVVILFAVLAITVSMLSMFIKKIDKRQTEAINSNMTTVNKTEPELPNLNQLCKTTYGRCAYYLYRYAYRCDIVHCNSTSISFDFKTENFRNGPRYKIIAYSPTQEWTVKVPNLTPCRLNFGDHTPRWCIDNQCVKPDVDSQRQLLKFEKNTPTVNGSMVFSTNDIDFKCYQNFENVFEPYPKLKTYLRDSCNNSNGICTPFIVRRSVCNHSKNDGRPCFENRPDKMSLSSWTFPLSLERCEECPLTIDDKHVYCKSDKTYDKLCAFTANSPQFQKCCLHNPQAWFMHGRCFAGFCMPTSYV